MIKDVRLFYMRRLYSEAYNLLKSEPWMRFNYFEHFMLNVFENEREMMFTVCFEHYSVPGTNKTRKVNTVWIHAPVCGCSDDKRMGAYAGVFTERNYIPEKYRSDADAFYRCQNADDTGVYFCDFSRDAPGLLDVPAAKFMCMAMHSTNIFLSK